MNRPDVRWEHVSHREIVDWVTQGRGAAVTERLEARLRSVAAALNANAELANGVLRQVDGGAWTGTAATVAAQAMRVLRDFDDTMRHHGEMNNLAAFGQSDNSSWVRANVPAVVETPRFPTGSPIDVLDSTVDYYYQLRAVKDAEEQARQVMRDYETMTVERITSLPPLAPAPQVVVSGREDTIVVDQLPPRDGVPDEGDGPRQSEPEDHEPLLSHEDAQQRRGDADGIGSSGHHSVGTPPVGDAGGDALPGGSSQTDPSGARSSLSGDGAAGHADETTRPITGPGVVGSEGDREPPRVGVPSVRGGHGGAPRGEGETYGRAKQGGLTGVAPTGTRQSDEDKEHQVRYRVPGSEIFEPDNVDGLLHDPFRPGSYVVPGSIGDDDDE
jgi:hypothetical protein